MPIGEQPSEAVHRQQQALVGVVRIAIAWTDGLRPALRQLKRKIVQTAGIQDALKSGRQPHQMELIGFERNTLLVHWEAQRQAKRRSD